MLNETVWLVIKTVSGVDLYVECVYMSTQGNVKHLCTDGLNLLEEIFVCFS